MRVPVGTAAREGPYSATDLWPRLLVPSVLRDGRTTRVRPTSQRTPLRREAARSLAKRCAHREPNRVGYGKAGFGHFGSGRHRAQSSNHHFRAASCSSVTRSACARTSATWSRVSRPSRTGEPKTERGRRVVHLDLLMVGVLRTWKAQQAATQLATGARKDRMFQVDPEVSSALVLRPGSPGRAPRIRFHDLRHTHASILAAAGVPPHVISARVGHATVGFILTDYSHVLPGHQADAAALVARAVLGDFR
jgi:Phage integrase family